MPITALLQKVEMPSVLAFMMLGIDPPTEGWEKRGIRIFAWSTEVGGTDTVLNVIIKILVELRRNRSCAILIASHSSLPSCIRMLS